ncbi:MAG: AAA family ATPase [Candidatus Thorarchaeota archaeon]
MKVINLFGGPGAGKSTTAAGLFFKMKTNNMKVELVTEFAKDLVYAERFKELRTNQVYITAKQYSKLERVRDQVDYVISDSPLILGLQYIPENYFNFFEPLVRELHYSFNNINIFIKRVKEYRNYGRYQTEEESDNMSNKIQELLNSNGIVYSIVNGDKTAPDTIFKLIMKGEL